jgi:hypothetical protein
MSDTERVRDRDEDVVDLAGELVVAAVRALATDRSGSAFAIDRLGGTGTAARSTPSNAQRQPIRGARALQVVPRPVSDVEPRLGPIDPRAVAGDDSSSDGPAGDRPAACTG